MNDKMAFRAAYADWKLIKTRGVVSISFEVPLNESHLAYEALGGMPVAAKEIWCGIAMLNPETEVMPPECKQKSSIETPPRQQETVDGTKTKTAFRDMRPSNQAAILCGNEPFRKFLGEKQGTTVNDSEHAAELVRWYCGVRSRSDIRPRTPSGDRWKQLFDEYQVWMHAPEFADA